ncbi:MAG: IclR family transcriptional regulator [Dermatophilaceae bacterium]
MTWRLLDILDCFSAQRRRMTLSEIARSAGLPLATAHRLVAVLTAWGALDRQPDGTYAVGRHLWEVGLLADVQSELKQVAAPFLQDLYLTTRESVYLAVRDGTQALYVDRLAGRVRPPIMAEVGSCLPLHATGVGKVLLAAAPQAVVDAVLADLQPVTPYTITDPIQLGSQLAGVRQRGFARTWQEMGCGTASVAVPVKRNADEVVAAVALVTADLRRDLSRMVPALQVSASGIARTLREQHVP